jgi:O-Antigen ligase
MALLSLRRPGSTRRTATLVIGLAVTLWLCVCGIQLLHDVDKPARFGIFVLGALILAPIVLLKVSRIPVYLLTIYAAAVPWTDLLPTSSGPTYTRLIGIVTGLALAFSMFVTGRAVNPSKSLVAVVLLAAYAGATIFWSIDSSVAFTAYGTYLSSILLFSVIALYPATLADMKLILGGTLAGAIAAAGYGAYLFWQGQSVAGPRLYIGWNSAHAIDPNEFGAMLLVPIAVTLMMSLRSRIGVGKLFWVSCLAILFLGFTASGSRGGSLAIGAMCLYILWRSPYKHQLMGVVSVIVLAALTSPIGLRFMQTDVSNGNGRLDVWKIGIASLHRYWLGGAGVGNFNAAYTQYFLTVPHGPVPWDRVAHSIFVGTAVELGLLGFVLMIALWYTQFRVLAYVRTNDKLIVDVCIALSAGVLGLFVDGFSLSLMLSKYTWLAFSLVALMRSALVVSGIEVDPPKRTKKR